MGSSHQKKKSKTPQDNEESQDNKKSQESKGGLISFVLLNESVIDLDLLAKSLEEDWGIIIPEDDIDKERESFVTEVDGMMVAVSLMPGPVPNGEAVVNAGTNMNWPEAVNVAETHKAHILVIVLNREQSQLDAAVLYVKVCAGCLRQPNASAINTLGSVFSPEFYIEAAEAYLENDSFPIWNLVFFGLYSNDRGKTFCGYTYGMDVFGKKNLEIIDSPQSPEDIQNFLVSIAGYVIESDVTLKDGETIGFSAEQKLLITESAGVALDESTLKIGF